MIRGGERSAGMREAQASALSQRDVPGLTRSRAKGDEGGLSHVAITSDLLGSLPTTAPLDKGACRRGFGADGGRHGDAPVGVSSSTGREAVMRAVRFPIEENHAVTRSGASAAPNRDTMRTMVVSAYPFVPATLT